RRTTHPTEPQRPQFLPPRCRERRFRVQQLPHGRVPEVRYARRREKEIRRSLIPSSGRFSDSASDSAIGAVAVQSDGKILAGGQFTSLGGRPRLLMKPLAPAVWRCLLASMALAVGVLTGPGAKPGRRLLR